MTETIETTDKDEELVWRILGGWNSANEIVAKEAVNEGRTFDEFAAALVGAAGMVIGRVLETTPDHQKRKEIYELVGEFLNQYL
jgi:hypothetical protein